MTVLELVKTLDLEVLAMPDSCREINGVYAGDLLSWVMGRAREDNAWATIMTNNNVLAVASLVNTSCVIICEDSEVEAETIALADAKEVNLLRTSRSIFEICAALAALSL